MAGVCLSSLLTLYINENGHCRQKEASMREPIIQPMLGVMVLTGQTQGHKGRRTSQRGGRKREEPEQQGTAHPEPEEKTPARSRNQNGLLTIPLSSSQIASFQKVTEPKQSMKMFANIAVRPAFRYIRLMAWSSDLLSP